MYVILFQTSKEFAIHSSLRHIAETRAFHTLLPLDSSIGRPEVLGSKATDSFCVFCPFRALPVEYCEEPVLCWYSMLPASLSANRSAGNRDINE